MQTTTTTAVARLIAKMITDDVLPAEVGELLTDACAQWAESVENFDDATPIDQRYAALADDLHTELMRSV